MFAALPGHKANGNSYISEAISKGALAVIAEEKVAGTLNFGSRKIIYSENPRRTYALAASKFFGAMPDTIAAVTGTNGKTSTVHFLCQIWSGLGLRSGALGTLGLHLDGVTKIVESDEKLASGNLTTPDSVDVHRKLNKLVEQDINNVAIEASSHGLAQYRLDGLKISGCCVYKFNS